MAALQLPASQGANVSVTSRSIEAAAESTRITSAGPEHQSEQQFRLLAETIPQMVWTARPDGAVDYYNQRWIDYTGLTLEESAGWDWELAVHPKDLQPCLDAWGRALDTGEAYQFEYRLRRAVDGAYRWHLGRALPVRDEDGLILKWFGTCTDIDDQKRAENALRFLSEAGDTLVDSLDDSDVLESVARLAVPVFADYCMIDLLERGIEIRRVAVAALDREHEAALRQRPRRLDLEPASNDVIAAVLLSGRSRIVSDSEALLWTNRGGALREQQSERSLQQRSSLTVPLIARGRTLGTVSLVRSTAAVPYNDADLSIGETFVRCAALAVDNARLYRESQEALRIRDEFLASISHDLRSPLTAIKGYAQLAAKQATRLKLAKTGPLLEVLSALDDTTSKMESMIAELLDLTRLQTARPLDLQLEPVDLVGLVRRCAADHLQTTSTHLIVVETAVESLTGLWDSHRIERVVSNLLSNAINYSPGGEIAVTIEPRVLAEVRLAVLIVTDRGMGIPVIDLPFVFERFHRGSNVRASTLGSGIGLAGSRQIVEQHGGTIEVASIEGDGSSITIMLPVEQVAAG